MSFCEDCVKKVIHDGTPKGSFEVIAGVNTYVARPSGDYEKTKAVLFLTDVFGPQLVNAQLLADAYAENNLLTYVPDYLHGDPFASEDFSKLVEWFPNHTQEKTRPSLDKVIAQLKVEGITSFAATGYCFGGRYVFDLSFDSVIKVAAVAHPSLLKVPEDLDKYVSIANPPPLLICAAEDDFQYPLEAQAQGDKIFAQLGENYKKEFFPGTTHGFAVRGDLSNPQIKAGNEGAFKATVSWFKKHL